MCLIWRSMCLIIIYTNVPEFNLTMERFPILNNTLNFLHLFSHCAYLYSILFLQGTTLIYVYSIRLLVSIKERHCVLGVIRTEFLCII
jgi:hypothetical protein